MATFHVEYTEKDLIKLVQTDLIQRFPEIVVNTEDLRFLVKSKNNYRPQEWENGQFKVEVNSTL